MYKILAAIRPEDTQLMRKVMGMEFEVAVCTTLAEAQAALAPDIAMIACGVHFDDGRMFDLLKYVKDDARFCDIPFWGLLHDNGVLSVEITRGIRTAMKTLGAKGLFNLSQLSVNGAHGPDREAVYRELRKAVLQSLSQAGS